MAVIAIKNLPAIPLPKFDFRNAGNLSPAGNRQFSAIKPLPVAGGGTQVGFAI